MSTFRFRTAASLAAVGAAPLLLCLYSSGLQGQPTSEPLLPASTLSARQVADDLDAIIQPHFQDDKASVFGMGRVMPLIKGHAAISLALRSDGFQTKSAAEERLLRRAASAERPYSVNFLHCAHVPGGPPDFSTQSTVFGQSATSKYRSNITEIMEWTPGVSPRLSPPQVTDFIAASNARLRLVDRAASEALPSLLKGEPQEKTVDGWLVVMRPVRASKSTCLTCHTGAKLDDTLGVMVYAVQNKVPKSAQEVIYVGTPTHH